MFKTGIASLSTEPVNLTQELDNGIIVIRQVKTVGYDVNKYTGKLSLIGFLYIRIAGKKIKLGSRRMIVIVHLD